MEAEGKEGAGRASQVGSICTDEPRFQPFQCRAAGTGCVGGGRSVRDLCSWCTEGRGMAVDNSAFSARGKSCFCSYFWV